MFKLFVLAHYIHCIPKYDLRSLVVKTNVMQPLFTEISYIKILKSSTPKLGNFCKVRSDFLLCPPQFDTYAAVLTFTDRSTKILQRLGMSKCEKANGTTHCFNYYIIGLPRSIIYDRDSDSCRDILGATTRHTSDFHPIANGQTKRTNQTFRQHLRTVAKRSSDWVAALDATKISKTSRS